MTPPSKAVPSRRSSGCHTWRSSVLWDGVSGRGRDMGSGRARAHAAGRCLLLDGRAMGSLLDARGPVAARRPSPILVALRTGEPRSDAALDRLTSTGFARIDLGTLDAGSCGQLVRQLRPGASDNVIERLWRDGWESTARQELSATDEPPTLRLAIAARSRHLGRRTEGRRAARARRMSPRARSCRRRRAPIARTLSNSLKASHCVTR